MCFFFYEACTLVFWKSRYSKIFCVVEDGPSLNYVHTLNIFDVNNELPNFQQQPITESHSRNQSLAVHYVMNSSMSVTEL